jgi:hypothetical protein
MGLVELIVLIAIIGVVVWAVTTLIPMPPQFRTAIYVVSVLFLAVYILHAFGLFSGFHDIRIGK